MALKEYCDHCGNRVVSRDIIELDFVETFYNPKTYKRAGVGAVLCPACYAKRQELHYNLDIEFLYKENNNDYQRS